MSPSLEYPDKFVVEPIDDILIFSMFEEVLIELGIIVGKF
jgi:hypothetical protein